MALLRHVAAPGLGLVAALVLLADTRDLDAVARAGQLGPGFWPRLVLGGLALACLARVVLEWRAHRRARLTATGAPAAGRRPAGRIRLKLLSAVGLILLYVATTSSLGFALATALFVAAFMWLAGGRSAAVLAVSAAGGTVVLLYVFVKLVYLPLPKGAGLFETATVALYRALGIF